MRKIIIAFVVLVVFGIGFYYMTPKKNSSNTPSGVTVDSLQNFPSTNLPANTSPLNNIPTPSSPVSASSLSTSSNVIPLNANVDINNFSFNPLTLTIKSGTKVTWVNNDSVSHTVASDAGNIFNSPVILPGESYSFAFIDTVGSLTYHCDSSKTMQGSIIITE